MLVLFSVIASVLILFSFGFLTILRIAMFQGLRDGKLLSYSKLLGLHEVDRRDAPLSYVLDVALNTVFGCGFNFLLFTAAVPILGRLILKPDSPFLVEEIRLFGSLLVNNPWAAFSVYAVVDSLVFLILSKLLAHQKFDVSALVLEKTRLSRNK